MNTITIMVETAGGSAQKYVFDQKLNCYKLKKRLPEGMAFPYDFGFIPGTKGEDGDPLDVIIVSEFNTFTGCAVEARIIGVLQCEQQKIPNPAYRNDRFLAIPSASFLFKNINSVHELPQYLIEQLGAFFENYNKAENKTFKITGIVDYEQAIELINDRGGNFG